MKKIVIFLIVCIVGFFNVDPYIVHAKSENSKLELELNSQIIKDLSNLDFDSLDDCLNNVLNDFGLSYNSSIKDVVLSITSGKYFGNYDSLFDGVLAFIFKNIKSVIPLIMMIIAVSILSSILNSIKSSSHSSISNLIHFVCFIVVVLLLTTSIANVVKITKNTLSNLTGQMQTIFPIMLTLLTASGGLTSVTIYKPIVSILCSASSVVFSNYLFPLFVLSFIFLILGNLSKNIKLNKFIDLINSIFKWSLGFVCTFFTIFMSIQGISASKFDSLSIRSTKFAVKSYIPLVGSFISDGFDLILFSSILIKNAVGVVGVILIAFTILAPIIQILALKFGLQLVSAILQPVGNSQIGDFCSGCSKVLVYPIVLILVLSFMFFLSMGLVMVTANLV